MPKMAKELSALAVKGLRTPGMHFVGGVAGLALQVLDGGSRSWVLRVRVGDKRRHMGLGSYADVSLSDAREKARQARQIVAGGADPVEDRRMARSHLKAAQAKAMNFKQASRDYVEAKGDEWRNAKHRAQWSATLETYAFPVLGDLLVGDIERAHVLKVLEPIWKTKNETASRVRGRIESVLDWAAVRGHRSAGENPAKWKGGLEHTLPKPGKVAKVEHHAALPIDDMPAFMTLLHAVDGMGSRALEFAILTAARSGEVRGAQWNEFDLEGKVWTVPADRMKVGKEHRVPLSRDAVALLKALPRIDDTEVVFWGARGGPLSDMTLTAVLRRMKVDAVPHGFRSTFRDWCSERTDFPREAAEMALAHSIGDRVEAAYRRGDLFDKRRLMMEQWSKFCRKS